MALVYKLVGFDRKSEILVLAHEIPSKKVLQAKTIAGIAGNPALIADWPLSRDQAGAIAELIGAELDIDGCDWALEPYTTTDTVQLE